MKKINLTIPKPCHENWDAMTKEDKGRFCGSCQKTVMDFSSMNDRQIAEFFKKPTGSVCGRFHTDQLEREILIPKKRIPWVRYFFQFTWPAFVLLLKSCGLRGETMGKMQINNEMSIDNSTNKIALLGDTVSFIMPVDTSSTIEMLKTSCVVESSTIGIIAPSYVEDVKGEVIQQKIEKPVESTIDTTEINAKPMDTLLVKTINENYRQGMIIAGSVKKITKCEIEKTTEKTINIEQLIRANTESNFTVYPNPVHAGSLLTISFSDKEDFPETIQLISSAGQIISSVKLNVSEYSSVVNISIPPNTAAGIYFVQVLKKNKIVKTTKVVVAK